LDARKVKEKSPEVECKSAPKEESKIEKPRKSQYNRKYQ